MTPAIALAHLRLVVADAHRPAAEHVRGPDEHRVADPVGDLDRRLAARRRSPTPGSGRRARPAAAPKRSRSSARSTASYGVPRTLNPASSIARASLSGVWPPNWITTPSGCSRSQTASTVLDVERLEVEPVGRVVVGRDRLGVAVDHDRLVAERAEALRGVDAAVVELDPLADPVRAGAEDDDARLAGRRHAARRPRRGSSSSSSSRPRPRRRRSRRGGRRARPAAARPSRSSLELAPEPRVEVVRQVVERRPRRHRARVELAARPAPSQNASWKVRPIPIASPTDFICVPSVVSAPGNFSNAKRGNLTTT